MTGSTFKLFRLRRKTSSWPAIRHQACLLAVEPLEGRLAPAVHFAVIGDYGVGQQPEQDVANLVHSWSPDFVVTTGDNNYSTPPLTTASYDTIVGKYYHDFISPYSGSYGAGAATNRFWPALGEHDYGYTPTGDQAYLSFFSGLPGNKRYYTVTQGPLALFILDTYQSEPDGTSSISAQAQWLQGALASSTAPWKLVFMYNPPYSSGPFGSTGGMNWPLQAWGASAVFSGHDHDYERLSENGIPYFVNGCGGAGLDPSPTTLIAGSQAHASVFGALKVDASPSQITFSFISTAGSVLDTYTMNYTLPAAPSSLAATAVSNTQINLKWTDNSANETGYSIERSTDGTNFTQIATVGPATTRYLDSGRSAGTTYYYRVAAYNTGGSSAYSNTANATIPSSLLPPIGAPTNLSATVASSNQVNLKWTDNSLGLDSFQIRRSTDGSNYTVIATVGAGTTSYADSGLAPATYDYQVVGTTLLGPMGSTMVASAVLAPAAPGNVTATAFFSHQINLSWTNNASNATGINILRSTDGVNFTSIATVGVHTTTFTNYFLTPSTTYFYRVSATNATGAASSASAAAATSPPTPPAAASNLTATTLNTGQIQLSWTDNSNPPNVEEDGFALYLSADGVNFNWVYTPGRDVTRYTYPGTLSPGTTYYFRIAAFNVDGFAAPSNTASAGTMSAPAAPSNLTATAVSSTQINLAWQDNSTSPAMATGFKLYRSTDQKSWSWFASTGQGVTTYTWYGGVASTTYYFYVTATSTAGESAPSNIASVTTPAGQDSRHLPSVGQPESPLPDVTYHGGPLLQQVQVESVYDGQVWSTDANLRQQMQQLDGFLNYFVDSPYIGALKQYQVSYGTFLGHDVVAQQQPGAPTLDDRQIRALLDAEIAAKHLAAPTADRLYVFFTAPGVVVTADGQDSVADFAGYHDVFTDSSGATVYYAVVPYPLSNISAEHLSAFQQATVVLSHEVSEAITDPDTRTGWFDPRFGEIGDITSGQIGSIHGYAVQAVWSLVDGKGIFPTGASGTTLQVADSQVHASAGPFNSMVATRIGAHPNGTAASFTTNFNWEHSSTSSPPGSSQAQPALLGVLSHGTAGEASTPTITVALPSAKIATVVAVLPRWSSATSLRASRDAPIDSGGNDSSAQALEDESSVAGANAPPPAAESGPEQETGPGAQSEAVLWREASTAYFAAQGTADGPADRGLPGSWLLATADGPATESAPATAAALGIVLGSYWSPPSCGAPPRRHRPVRALCGLHPLGLLPWCAG